MKLPNWLHRKPVADYDTDRFDSFAEALEAKNDALYGGPLRVDPYFTQPDPYLNSLVATPTFAVGASAPELASLKERWGKANGPLFLTPPESVEIAHTRGYWEGRAEGRAEARPEYRVEVIRDDADWIDEVLLHDATRCLFHLERLDTDRWWITLSPRDGWADETTYDIFRVKKRIEVTEQ